MIKIIQYLLLSIIFIFPLEAESQSLSLGQMASILNEHCPQEGYGGLVRILGYSFSNNIFEVDWEMNMGDAFNVAKAVKKPKECKELLLILQTSFHQQTGGELDNKIIAENAKLRFKITTAFSSDVSITTITAEELKAAFEKYGKMSNYERTLVSQKATMNMQAPIVEDEFTTTTNVDLTSSSLIYYVELDEIGMGVSNFTDKELDDFKKDMIFSLSQSPVKELVVNACLNTFRTMTYVFTFKHSKKQYKIVFNSTDLREIIK